MIKVFVLCFLLLTGSGAQGDCAQPLDDVQRPLDEIIRILKDPSYQNTSQKTVQREKIWKIVVRVFDFKEISRRTLARHWKNFSPEQQKEFTAVFSEFLGNIYIRRIQVEFKNENMVYLGQEMMGNTKALVKTKIIRENNIEIPVDYSVRKKSDGWRIYDVNIEGVSLVKNYRSQFKGILIKEKPADLIGILKEKIKTQKKKAASSDWLYTRKRLERERYELLLIAQRYFFAIWADADSLRRQAQQ